VLSVHALSCGDHLLVELGELPQEPAARVEIVRGPSTVQAVLSAPITADAAEAGALGFGRPEHRLHLGFVEESGQQHHGKAACMI